MHVTVATVFLMCRVLSEAVSPRDPTLQPPYIYRVPTVSAAISACTELKPSLSLYMMNIRYLQTKKRPLPQTGEHTNKLLVIALILSGDIQTNPGHDQTVYPCGYFLLTVSWSAQAVCCDGCNVWYHYSCLSMSATDLESLSKDNVIWLCCK